MSTQEMPSVQELVAARDLAQLTHDYVEREGFSIHSYSTLSTPDPRISIDIDGKLLYRVGAVCFIGGFRNAAGVRPMVEVEGDRTDWGNGPELTLALTVGDEVARRLVDEEHIDLQLEYAGELPALRDDIGPIKEEPGRLLERYGFRALEEMGEGEKDFALATLREILTELNRRIERAMA